MADKENRQIPLALDADKQLHNCFLYGNIECTRCLIADQNLRLERKRTRDPYALTLSAAHVCGVAFSELLGQINETQQFCSLVPRTSFEKAKVSKRFADDVLDLHLRIERGRRVLEHHLDVAPHIACILALESSDLLVFKEDLPLRRRMQLHQCAHQCTLSAAALTDDAENISPIDGESHVIACREHLSALQRKVLRQVLDAQNCLMRRCCHNAPLQSAALHAEVLLCNPSVGAQSPLRPYRAQRHCRSA